MRVRYPLGACLMAALLASLSGCSSSTVNLDYDENIDFSRYETFGWLEQKGGATHTNVPMSTANFQRARQTADAIMVSKGFRKVGAAPNLGLAIHVGSGWKLDVASWGYSASFAPGGYGDGLYPKGSLIIDIVDSRSKRLVWRGVSSGAINDTGKPTSNIEDIVATILNSFPPD